MSLSWIKKASLATLLCAATAVSAFAADLPVLKTGFIFTTHHTPFLVACSQGENLKEMGVWLKEVEPRVAYELMKGDKAVALLDLVVCKNGAESATLIAQKHMDLGLGSVTAIMAGVDKGIDMKIICPLQTEGMGLIAPKGSDVKTIDDFVALVKKSQDPVIVGFHSPTSAPKIVFEAAMRNLGFKVSLDPADRTADILLSDLKETSNLLAALTAKQVDAVVGPSPFPEIAVTKGAGQLLCSLRDLPPVGKWQDFPCCVAVASAEVMADQPQAVQAYVDLLVGANQWSNDHRQEAGAIAAEWLGLPAEAGRMSNLIFLNDFNKGWLAGADRYLKMLNDMNKLNGSIKGKTIDECRDLLIDDSWLKAANK